MSLKRILSGGHISLMFPPQRNPVLLETVPTGNSALKVAML